VKLGDLVSLTMKKTQPPQETRHAIVLDVYIDQNGHELAEIMWEGTGLIRSYRPDLFEVISEAG
jgi:hypothetical protein|tara:strand:- start:1516 stop:1707 length:192 start_codon:yes stop_codon:yes gene_type:complete